MGKRKFNLITDLDKIATEVPISSIMTTEIFTAFADDTVEKAIGKMARQSISGILVVDRKAYPLGIVSEGDIIKKVLSKGRKLKTTKMGDIMSSPLMTVKPSLSIGETAQIMKKHGISKLPVVENKKLAGIVTKSDLLEALNKIYYQNTRLKWLPIILLVQFIVIAALIVGYVNK
jgi:CBS domain-containing protein